MGYTTIFSNGLTPNMVKKFAVDNKTNLSEIDVSQLLPGSRAFVIEESQWYMLKNDYKTWAPVDLGSSGSGGGGSEDTDHIYYTGGSEDNEQDPDDNIHYTGGSEDDG